MLRKFFILSLLLICPSCGIGFVPWPHTGVQHYKYKCKKAGDCCEVGKNCKEDVKNKEVEK